MIQDGFFEVIMFKKDLSIQFALSCHCTIEYNGTGAHGTLTDLTTAVFAKKNEEREET